jgi:hypothetical protein
MPRWTALLAALVLVAGCVERTMTIKSDPPGALIYLNDREIGRTPVTRDFTWYGNYQVEVRKDGYETLKTHKWVIAPAYEWIPLDLLAELVPVTFRDRQKLFFQLKPETSNIAEAGPMLSRAEQLKSELQSSEHTRKPATRAATKPTKK